jgi:serine/threonine-protein kinase HipA
VNAHTLWVFDGVARVGVITHDPLDDAFTFAYDPAWPQRENAYPLSPHFPLKGPNPASATVRRFIANLLPEGRALDLAAAICRVSKHHLFGLIRELGAETAGALAFLPEGADPARQVTRRREISRAELARRIEERDHQPLAVWDDRVRMSLAGYQDKLAVYCEEERFYLVEGALASTHILKPEPGGRLPLLAANELFCMRLARRIGLPAAEVDIQRLPHPVLRVTRFDRERQADAIRRLPIIDACQALDLPVAYKYERNFGSGPDVRQIREGVSLPRLLGISRYMTRRALATQLLIRWALFQYVIGNSDAHGKNVSFFCRPDGLELAPFYDLVSVVQYPDIDHDFAMAYGDEFDPERVTPYDWGQFAHDCDLRRSYLAREMVRLAKAVQREAPREAAAAVYIGIERDLVQSLQAFVRAQAERLANMAQEMRTMDAALF